MTRARSTVVLALVLALAPGCYCSHLREDGVDAGAEAEDADAPRDGGGDGEVDGGVPTEPCTTVCDPPRVLARVALDVGPSHTPAVLDAVVHRDELVVSLLIGERYVFGEDRGRAFSLARVSRRTGDARIEVVEVRVATGSIGAAALASRGETLTLIAAHGGEPITEVEPRVLLAIWEGAAPTPTTFDQPLTDVVPHCARCFRRGASVAVGGDGGIVALTGEGVLHVGHVRLDTGAVVREAIALPSVLPNTALDARGDRMGSAIVVVGGVREVRGAPASPALAMVASESALEAPISIPGDSSDSVPHPWLHGGALEVVRFLRDDGVAGGRLHRYAIEGAETAEIGTIPTAGGLPPLVMASTASALLWVESSLALVGEADLRVLAAPPATCAEVTPATVVHLPTPLADLDPRAMVATEADGHTYAAVIEQEAGTFEGATLVVFDLGVCRDGA